MSDLDTKDCLVLFRTLRKMTTDVGVLVDGGWDEKELTYTIITDGNGQKPHGEISAEVFQELRKKGWLGGNTLVTYKKRRFHRFYPHRQRKQPQNCRGDSFYRGRP